MFKKENMNSGYVGYSMSVRAVQAYEDGDRPKSKWTKKEILSRIEYKNYNFTKEAINKMPVKILKEQLLTRTSWHHTGKFLNKTEFYNIDYDYLDELTNEKIENIIKEYKEEEEKKKTKKYKGTIKYLEWGRNKKASKSI